MSASDPLLTFATLMLSAGPMCPGYRAPASTPFQGIIFTTDPGGRVRPSFQRNAFGYGLEGKTLWLALRGYDCGAKDTAVRCDRPIAWVGKAKVYDVAPAALTRSPSRILR